MAKQNTKGAKAKGTKKRKVNVEAVGGTTEGIIIDWP